MLTCTAGASLVACPGAPVNLSRWGRALAARGASTQYMDRLAANDAANDGHGVHSVGGDGGGLSGKAKGRGKGKRWSRSAPDVKDGGENTKHIETAKREIVESAPSEQLRSAVAAVENLARSLKQGRTVKMVTEDPETASCAHNLTAALPGDGSGGARGKGREPAPMSVAVARELTRAASAFSRIRIMHSPLLGILGDLRINAWRDLPTVSLIEAVVAYAWLQAADRGLLRRWAVALDNDVLSRVSSFDLASLVWAAATLQMGGLHSLHARLLVAVEEVDFRQLQWKQFSQLSWGLARMTAPGGAPSSWTRRAASALQANKRIPVGLSLGELCWAFGHLGESAVVSSLFRRAPAQALGRDAYCVLLREAKDCSTYVAVLQHMAAHSRSAGLKAVLLNVAVMRSLSENDFASAHSLLSQMTAAKVWNPVTYRLASQLAAKEGTADRRSDGSPPYPGLVNPGQGTHKYVRAVYHMLERSAAGDIDGILASLDHYSRKRGWLKFGAADEKGQVIEEALRQVVIAGKPRVALEFGSFIGYSAMRMARVLGPDARIVTLEMDPEVACLAMNVVEYAGIAANVEVLVGECGDLMPRLEDRLAPRSVGFAYMDHNQMTYHEDLARLEVSRLLCDRATLAFTQCLKPGAPLLLWRLAEAQRAGRGRMDIVSSPDCGCPRMEDWVVLAESRVGASETPWLPPEPPSGLRALAAECNLMRWRTAQGLVDEQRWEAFVQYVRRGIEQFVGVESTRSVWPSPAIFTASRKLEYTRLDY